MNAVSFVLMGCSCVAFLLGQPYLLIIWLALGAIWAATIDL